MDIYEQDLLIAKMKDEIKSKQECLFQRFKELQKNKQENEYLESIKNDYAKYFNNISSIKKDQLNAFQNINKYLNKTSCKLEIKDSLLKEMREDQQKVLTEIDKLKIELNKIIIE